jgi:hypothetical protein
MDPANTTAEWDTLSGQLRMPEFQMTLAGSLSLGSTCTDLVVDGDRGYAALGSSGLGLLDLTDLSSPSPLATLGGLGYVQDVAIDGNTAYLASDLGLQIVDVTSAPVHLGNGPTAGSVSAVHVDGDHAYTLEYGTLSVWDVEDPTAPSLVAVVDSAFSQAGTLAGSGDHLFLDGSSTEPPCLTTYGLIVIDVSERSAPYVAGCSQSGTDGIRGIAIDGDWAYLADLAGGLHVVDISNPSSPQNVGHVFTPGYAYDLVVAGRYVYVTVGGYAPEALTAYDVSDPTSPTLLTSVTLGDSPTGIALSGDHVFTTDWLGVLRTVRVADTIDPHLAGSTSVIYPEGQLALAGDHAYLADGMFGLRVIDIRDPANPVIVGTADTPGAAEDVDVSGNLAYVADGTFGYLQVVDISDPTNPTVLGQGSDPGGKGVDVQGHLAYVAAGLNGFYVLDVSDPTSPTLRGADGSLASTHDVVVTGDLAYVADEYDCLGIYDVSDPTDPTLLGGLDPPGLGYGFAVDVSGDFAYVAEADSGLRIIDVATPSAPSLAATVTTGGIVYGVRVDGDRAYLADNQNGLYVVDVSDPYQPAILSGGLVPPGSSYAFDVALAGDFAYLAAQGLHAIQVLQRRLQLTGDRGQSTTLPVALPSPVLAARITPVESPSVDWEITADGATWQSIASGTWTELTSPGSDLRWRSLLSLSHPDTVPAVHELILDWLYAEPLISDVADIPDDQGGQVRVSWNRSAHDAAGTEYEITGYSLWRKIAGSVSRRRVSVLAEAPVRPAATLPLGSWDYVTTVPARGDDTYNVVAPTLCDSTVAGDCYSTFFVSAMTSSPLVFFDSPPDSGHSIDNIAPRPPDGLNLAGTVLSWDALDAEDFDYFSIYGGDGPDVGEATLLGHTVDIEWNVAGSLHAWYHVTATDQAGNEGAASSLENGATLAPALPRDPSFELHPVRPHPVRGPAFIEFTLSAPGPAKLALYDVAGREVAELRSGWLPSGPQSLTWDGRDSGGHPLGPGVYFLRLEAGGEIRTRKVVMVTR